MKTEIKRGQMAIVCVLGVLAWGLAGFVPGVQAADISAPLTTVQGQKGTPPEGGEVQERAVQQFGVLGPPYACGAEAGVCLCVSQANCDQMTQPKPCKRPKFCSGQQVAQPPPPLPGQEVPQSMARTAPSMVICSCRSAP